MSVRPTGCVGRTDMFGVDTHNSICLRYRHVLPVNMLVCPTCCRHPFLPENPRDLPGALGPEAFDAFFGLKAKDPVVRSGPTHAECFSERALIQSNDLASVFAEASADCG